MTHRAALAHHLIRIIAPLVLLIIAPCDAARIGIAFALYIGVFMLAHELTHDVFGPTPAGLLAAVGVAMATSGHALRTMHLHHHAHPFAPDDLEGLPAAMSPRRALVVAPPLALQLMAAAWRRGPRGWQAVEYAAIVAALAGVFAVGPLALQIYLGVAVAMQLLAPFWAGHLIHHPPRGLVAIAAVAARAGSLAARSLIVHDDHHRRPAQPTITLALQAAGRRAPALPRAPRWRRAGRAASRARPRRRPARSSRM